MIENISNIYSLKRNLEIRCQYYLKGLHPSHTKTLCSIDNNALCLYDRLRRNQHCVDIYKDSVLTIINESSDLDQYKAVELVQSMINVVDDLSKIHPCAAAIAWITPNGNLNSDFDDPFIPTDLNYGLILKAFNPVLRVCNYLTATGTYESDMKKFKDIWNSEEYCNNLLETASKWLNTTTTELREAVSSIINI